MSSVLIKKLSSDLYQLVTEQGTSFGTLGELAPLVSGKEPVLIMPASSCTLLQVGYEDHERKLLARIIPFSLEDGLIDRVDDLHFVINKLPQDGRDNANTAAVCYLEKSLLAEELRRINEHGITVSGCLPELLLLPWQPGQWTLAMAGDNECLIRTGFCEGIACTPENLPLTLKILGREKEAPERVLACLPVSGEGPDEHQLAGMLPGAAGGNLELVREDYLQLLCRALPELGSSVAGMNLLTGEFAPQLPWGAWWKQWRVAAVLLVAVGAADLGTRVVEINRLDALDRTTASETEAIFRQVIPEGVIVDPRVQLQRRLESLQGNGMTGFVSLLNRAAPVIMNNPELEVRNLNYSERDRAIQMTLITSDFNSAESVRARLQALGLQAELTGTTSSPEGNRSELRIGS